MTWLLSSRRGFLQQVSAAVVATKLPLRGDSAWWCSTPNAFIPEPDEALVRRLAMTAIETARAAGAGFADVRVVTGRQLSMGSDFNREDGRPPTIFMPECNLRTEYGIRALVDGAWGFAAGSVTTAEAVATATRAAVSRAKTNRPRHRRTLELAPVPIVANGTWATPIERNPFTVSLREQTDLMLAALAAAEGVRGAVRGGLNFGWREQLRAFASTDGTSIVQRIFLARPDGAVSGKSQTEHRPPQVRLDAVKLGGYGYEAVTRIDLAAEMRRAMERSVQQSSLLRLEFPEVEIGRYDLVLDGQVAGGLLRQSIGEALNLERALGYRANRDGTSFAAPPEDMIGKYQIAAPSMTVKADRTRPHALATVGWDDEGVAGGEWALVKDGVVADYLSSRQTIMESAAAASGAKAARSNGCASGAGTVRPEVRLPNLTLEPGADDLSVADLIAGTKRGFYLEKFSGYDEYWFGGGWVNGMDQQLISGQFGGAIVLHKIQNGKLAGPVSHFAFQFITSQFWKNVDALGGPKSVTDVSALTDNTLSIWQDWLQFDRANVRAVPMRVRQVNVLNTGRTA